MKKKKLVRDRIVRIITAETGMEPGHELLTNHKSRIRYAKKKIVEEASEIEESRTPEELIGEIADLQEILQALMREAGISEAEVKKIRREKNKKKGAFRKWIVMEICQDENKQKRRRGKNEADLSMAHKNALLLYIRRRDWEGFVGYASNMSDDNMLWGILENLLLDRLTDFFVGTAKRGYFTKLFEIDAKRSIGVLQRLGDTDLARVLASFSQEEMLLVIRNAKF